MSYGDYPDLSRVKRVLVIKLRHHGDVLLTSPVFTLLKKTLPDAQVDAFIYSETLPMLQGHPAIGKFFLYDPALKKRSWFFRLLGEAKLLLKVRREKYDLVINLTEGDRGAIIALAARGRYRVGFDPGKSGFLGKRKIYTHLVKSPKTPRHTVERQLDALRRIGIFPEQEERNLLFQIPPEANQRIRTLLQQEEIKPGNFFLIHPVSRWRFKCPPPAFTVALIEELHQHGPVILTSGPDPQERALMAEITKKAPFALDLGGKISLKELGALIALSRCLICVDSVPLHIASALKAPVVALFGPTSEENWGPWQNTYARVIAQPLPCRPCNLDGCGGSKRSDCLYTLSPERVAKEVLALVGDETFVRV